MPLQATSGAASYDAFGGGVAVAPKYIEDFFQTWLRTGTGSSATVTTGLNASINKSLVWTKSRFSVTNHKLTDTVRGATKALSSNTTGAEVTDSQGLTAFGSTGYTIGTLTNYNNSGTNYVDWQWLATPKFFDVVTWTGTGATFRDVSHNLQSVPGCVIIKRTDSTSNWSVWHRSLGATFGLQLNTTNAATDNIFADPFATSTSFQALGFNNTGATYVAYLFAHDAGGFGLTGTDNVISCGSYSSTSEVNLGYEPQWILRKRSAEPDNWQIYDTMRGWSNTDYSQLNPNLSNSEDNTSNTDFFPTATGFRHSGNSANFDYIYIAIRRGPMKVPTTGTSVFQPVAYTGTNVDNRLVDTGIVTDMTMARIRTATSTGGFYTADRLRGNASLGTAITDPENTDADSFMTPTLGRGNSFSAMNGFGVGNDATRQLNQSSTAQLAYAFQRAPSFFDEVCYTGTGSNMTVAHNLAAVPELMIVKRRAVIGAWDSYSASLANTEYVVLNTTAAKNTGATRWNSTSPTATVFSLGTATTVNASGEPYVSYLFASAPGVSKVGSYTGTGTTQQINCGFTGGARFVLIKRTDSIGAWYVWDTARGIVAGDDPYLLLNTTAAEVTNTDFIDPASTGFEISSTAPAAINASGGTFIFLAIA
jgi:hypothetical protein